MFKENHDYLQTHTPEKERLKELNEERRIKKMTLKYRMEE